MVQTVMILSMVAKAMILSLVAMAMTFSMEEKVKMLFMGVRDRISLFLIPTAKMTLLLTLLAVKTALN